MVVRTKGFVPPVAPKDVVGTGHGWMEPVSMEGAHKAVDLQAVRGTPALSPIDGVVANVKYEPQGLGLQVQVMGRDKKLHTLAHLDRVHVAIGDRVKAGQGVAEVGDSGAGATGPHLDYRRQTEDGQYDDPTADLGPLAQMPRADKPPGWGPKDENEDGIREFGDYERRRAPQLNPGWSTFTQDFGEKARASLDNKGFPINVATGDDIRPWPVNPYDPNNQIPDDATVARRPIGVGSESGQQFAEQFSGVDPHGQEIAPPWTMSREQFQDRYGTFSADDAYHYMLQQLGHASNDLMAARRDQSAAQQWNDGVGPQQGVNIFRPRAGIEYYYYISPNSGQITASARIDEDRSGTRQMTSIVADPNAGTGRGVAVNSILESMRPNPPQNWDFTLSRESAGLTHRTLVDDALRAGYQVSPEALESYPTYQRRVEGGQYYNRPEYVNARTVPESTVLARAGGSQMTPEQEQGHLERMRQLSDAQRQAYNSGTDAEYRAAMNEWQRYVSQFDRRTFDRLYNQMGPAAGSPARSGYQGLAEAIANPPAQTPDLANSPDLQRYLEQNRLTPEQLSGREPMPGSPALPHHQPRAAAPGVAGFLGTFPNEVNENLVQPGLRAIGEWFNPPPAGGSQYPEVPMSPTGRPQFYDTPGWDPTPQMPPPDVRRQYDDDYRSPAEEEYGGGQDAPAGYGTHWIVGSGSDVGVGQFEGYGGDIGQFGGLSGYEDPSSYGMGGYGAGPQYGSYGGGWNPYGENYDLSGAAPSGSPGQGNWYDSFPNSYAPNPSFPGPQGLGDWFDSFANPSPMAASMQAYGNVGPETPGGSGGFGGPGYNYGSSYGGSAWSTPSPPGMGGYGGGGNAYTGGPPLGAPGFSGTPSGYRDITGSYGGRSSGGGGGYGSQPQSQSRGAQSQSSQSGGGYGSQGRDTMPFEIPEGVYGQSKWMPGTGTDIFMRRGSPITAKTGGQVLYATGGTGLSGGSDTIAQFDDGTVARFRHVQPGLQAGSRFSAGQTIATIGDSSMDMLNPQVAGQIGAPDGYQHLDLSINRPGNTQFSPQGGGGGDIPAAQWLQQHGYRGRVVSRTPGPQEGQMGGIGGFGGSPGGVGMGGFPGGGYPGFGSGGFPGGMGFGGFGRGQDVGVGADFSLLPASTTNLALIKSQGWDPSGGATGGTGATPPGATGPADPTVPSRTPKGNPVPFSPGFPGPSNSPWTPATQATYAALVAAENGATGGTSPYAAAAGGTPGAAGATGGGMGGWPTIPAGWTGGGAFDPFVRPGRVQMFDRPDPTADRLPWITSDTPQTPYSPSLDQSKTWGQAAQAMMEGAPPVQNYASGIMSGYQSPPWLRAGAGGTPGGGGGATPPPLASLQPFRTGEELSRQFLTDSHFVPSAPFPPPVGGGQDAGRTRVLDAVRTGRGWMVPDVGVGQSPYDSFGQAGTNPYAGFSAGGGGQTPPTSYDTSGGSGSLGFDAGSFGANTGQQQNQQGQLFIGPTEAETLSQGRYGLLLNTAQLGLNQQLGYNTMLGTQGQLQQIDDQYRQYYDALKQQYAIHGNDDLFRRQELALNDQRARDIAMMQYGTQQQGNAVNLTGLQLNYDQAMKRLEQEWQIHGDDNQYRNDVLALQRQTQEQANALAQNQQTQQGNQFWANLGEQESQYIRSLEEQRNQFGQNLGFQRETAQAQDLRERDLAALQARNAGFDRQLALSQTALRNPWVQQLSGMAPAYGAPGGPGAAYAAAAGGAPVGWTGGGQDSGPGWSPVGAGADNPYAAWGTDPTGYGMGPVQRGGGVQFSPTTTSQSGLGYDTGFRMLQGAPDRPAIEPPPTPSNPDPRPAAPPAPDPGWYQGYQQAYGQSTGGNPSPYDLNNDQIIDIRDFGLWRQQGAPGNPAANPPPGTLPPKPPMTGWPTGFNGLEGGFNPAPLYTPPPTPAYSDYASFAAMDPFQRAGLRTQAELSGMPWEQYTQGLRSAWGAAGGPTTAPTTTQLAAQQYNPLQVIGQNQLAEAFGQSPDQYWKAQTRGWMPSQWSGAQMQV